MENLLRSKEYWVVVESCYSQPESEEGMTAAQKKILEESQELLFSIFGQVNSKDNHIEGDFKTVVGLHEDKVPRKC